MDLFLINLNLYQVWDGEIGSERGNEKLKPKIKRPISSLLGDGWAMEYPPRP